MMNIFCFNKKNILIYLLFVLISSSLQIAEGQNTTHLIKGQLIDKQTKESLPYAHVHNTRTKKGAVTDDQGYFGIKDNKIGDTITVSFIGYISQNIIIKSHQPLQIKLQENKTKLSEITLEYDNSEYLYKLIKSCAKMDLQTKAESKAYYELHTTMDEQQIELVEMFFNAKVEGYDLEELKMKIGKFGIQGNKFGGANISLESSTAILKSSLFESAEYFPKNPFQLSYNKLKKSYDLYKVKEYIDKSESILVIRFNPKKSDSKLFNGLVWINKNTAEIHKIELECENCKEHPFYMITNTIIDLERVDLNIVKTFEKKKEGMILNHVDFKYDFEYLRGNLNVNLKTNVLVHLYDFENLFDPPKFDKTNERRHSHDYRLIKEAPYNTFFWDNHNEFSIFDQGNQNETFFNHPNTIGVNEFGSLLYYPGRTHEFNFEHPSFKWSKKRLRFAEPSKTDTTTERYKQQQKNGYTGAFNGQFKSDMYKFYGKIYLDRNEYNGEINVITKSIFDSSRSFYKLPVDWKVQVFVNMYFDLVEIERRELEKEIEVSDKTISTIDRLYTLSETRLAKTHKLFLKEVRRGENMTAMEKWNEEILSELRINNLESFIKN